MCCCATVSTRSLPPRQALDEFPRSSSAATRFQGCREYPRCADIGNLRDRYLPPLAKEHDHGPSYQRRSPEFLRRHDGGPIDFHKWIGDGWACCSSSEGLHARLHHRTWLHGGLAGEFAKRNTKIIGISVDPVESHHRWKADIKDVTGHAVDYPLIGDPQLKIAKLYDMLPASAGDTSEGRTPADNATVRSVFVVGPDKKVKLSLTYPMTTGRNFDEILRVIDSLSSLPSTRWQRPPNGSGRGRDHHASRVGRGGPGHPAASPARSPISGDKTAAGLIRPSICA